MKKILLLMVVFFGVLGLVSCTTTEPVDGIDGREIQIRVQDDLLQWQYEGDTTWYDLLDLETLQGADGQDGTAGVAGTNGTDGADGEDGTDGSEVTFRVTETAIEWQYVGATTWTSLIPLSLLQGPAGQDGEDGEDGEDGLTPYIGTNGNWFIGTTDTLVPATGPRGAQGLPGPMGPQGLPGAQGVSVVDVTLETIIDAENTFNQYEPDVDMRLISSYDYSLIDVLNQSWGDDEEDSDFFTLNVPSGFDEEDRYFTFDGTLIVYSGFGEGISDTWPYGIDGYNAPGYEYFDITGQFNQSITIVLKNYEDFLPSGTVKLMVWEVYQQTLLEFDASDWIVSEDESYITIELPLSTIQYLENEFDSEYSILLETDAYQSAVDYLVFEMSDDTEVSINYSDFINDSSNYNSLKEAIEDLGIDYENLIEDLEYGKLIEGYSNVLSGFSRYSALLNTLEYYVWNDMLYWGPIENFLDDNDLLDEFWNEDFEESPLIFMLIFQEALEKQFINSSVGEPLSNETIVPELYFFMEYFETNDVDYLYELFFEHDVYPSNYIADMLDLNYFDVDFGPYEFFQDMVVNNQDYVPLLPLLELVDYINVVSQSSLFQYISYNPYTKWSIDDAFNDTDERYDYVILNAMNALRQSVEVYFYPYDQYGDVSFYLRDDVIYQDDYPVSPDRWIIGDDEFGYYENNFIEFYSELYWVYFEIGRMFPTYNLEYWFNYFNLDSSQFSALVPYGSVFPVPSGKYFYEDNTNYYTFEGRYFTLEGYEYIWGEGYDTDVHYFPGYDYENETGSAFYFDFWAISSDYVYDNPFEYDVAQIYAIWQERFVVSFDAQGGSANPGSSLNEILALDETTYNLPSVSKTGYSFNGWYSQASGGTLYNSVPSNLSENVTLYAQWSANDYNLTFDANFGDNETETQVIPFGSTEALDTNPFTRTGYTFSGWNSSRDGEGTDYANLANYTMNSEGATLYAQWTPDVYTLFFNGNTSTSGTMTGQAITFDQSATITTNAFNKTGYSFTGWNTESNGTGDSYINGGTFTMNVEDDTLYAQWSANDYTISFDTNSDNDVTNPDDITVTYDDTYGTLPDLTNARPGYIFNGWYTDTSGGTIVSANDLVVVTSNTTLYAQWTAINYNISTSLTPAEGSVATKVSGIVRGSAIVGTTVTVEIDVNAGFVVALITVTDGSGVEIEVTEDSIEDGLYTYTFTMPADSVDVEVDLVPESIG
jgi:uncharacterized repeat protein (TIGR02543 family)